ncbi:MAG: SRPBCC domain-containing protein [Williamsia sp.]|nr:SRPBCC domain-containing protein [Williamsia sp.]
MNNKNELSLTYSLSVPPQQVFDAWTIPALMKSWLFKSEDNDIFSIDTDLRRGGRFSILERNGGEVIDHFGQYTKVEAPGQLAFTLEVPKHFSGVSQVSVCITETPGGCRMKFRQWDIDTRQTRKSWEMMLRNLKMMLES